MQLILKTLQFTDNFLEIIAESYKNILQLNTREFFGYPAFYNINDLLFTRNIQGFEQSIANTIQGWLEIENRATINNITVEKVNDYTYNITIDVSTEFGRGNIEIVVTGF